MVTIGPCGHACVSVVTSVVFLLCFAVSMGLHRDGVVGEDDPLLVMHSRVKRQRRHRRSPVSPSPAAPAEVSAFGGVAPHSDEEDAPLPLAQPGPVAPLSRAHKAALSRPYRRAAGKNPRYALPSAVVFRQLDGYLAEVASSLRSLRTKYSAGEVDWRQVHHQYLLQMDLARSSSNFLLLAAVQSDERGRVVSGLSQLPPS